jgi:hypothetical protein
MFCYTLLKIIHMPGVVGVIGTAQNVNPETHLLSFVVLEFLGTLHLRIRSPSTTLLLLCGCQVIEAQDLLCF